MSDEEFVHFVYPSAKARIGSENTRAHWYFKWFIDFDEGKEYGSLGEGRTKDEAWNTARKVVEYKMLEKLES